MAKKFTIIALVGIAGLCPIQAMSQNLSEDSVLDCKAAQPADMSAAQQLPVTERYTVSPKYEWVKGEILGSSIEVYIVPATYKTVVETIVVVPSCYVIPVVGGIGGLRKKTLPAITQTLVKHVVVTPSKVIKRTVPNIVRNGKTRIMIEPARVLERVVSY